jgi:hypothetical protein
MVAGHAHTGLRAATPARQPSLSTGGRHGAPRNSGSVVRGLAHLHGCSRSGRSLVASGFQHQPRQVTRSHVDPGSETATIHPAVEKDEALASHAPPPVTMRRQGLRRDR